MSGREHERQLKAARIEWIEKQLESERKLKLEHAQEVQGLSTTHAKHLHSLKEERSLLRITDVEAFSSGACKGEDPIRKRVQKDGDGRNKQAR